MLITQIYLALSPNDYGPLESLRHCIEQINKWRSLNFLELNKDKTEVIMFGEKEASHKIADFLDPKGSRQNKL